MVYYFLKGLNCVLEKLGDNGQRRILYVTWGRKPGSKTLDDHDWTNPDMTQGLREAYARAAKQVNAEVSNVGLCFYRVLSEHPEIELYNPDLSHPANTGSLQLTSGEVEAFRESICR